jgi:type IV pilus assembly protein PilC
MIKAGVSIVDALDALKDESDNKYFQSQLTGIIQDVNGGAPFSQALSKHPALFSQIYISMVKSGEESGKLDLVLNRLSVQLNKEYELNRKIRGALAYPIFVICTLAVVIVLILALVIPQLKSVFDSSGATLPPLTRAMMWLGNTLKSYGVYLFVVLAVLVILLYRFRKTAKGKEFFDSLILKIPIINNLYKKTYMARFARTFAALTSSGLPLLDVFKISGDTIGNVKYQKEIEKMGLKVKSGQPISKTLKDSPLFPKMVGQLASVGEKSGSLDEVFDTVANFYDRDVDNIASNLSTLLEPALMVVLGVIVGLIILSVIQPIYGLVNAI